MLGEPGAEKGHRDNHPTRQAGNLCVDLHHLLVGDLIGAPDLPNVGFVSGLLDGRDQDFEHVHDGDRLASGAPY